MRKYNSASLPFIAAAAQALQFAHSGYVYADWPGAVIGLVIGVTVSLSVATAASRISGIAQKRKPLAWVSLVTLLVLSPACIAPAAWVTFTVIPDEAVRILAACTWAAAPDLAIVLSGAIAGKSMVTVETTAEKPVEARTESNRTRRTAPVKHTCELCGATYNSKGAHMRHRHPDKVQHRVYAVQVQEDK